MQPQTTQPQPTLNFVGLSIDEANAIFAGLEEMPHKRVAGLIAKLVMQTNAQLNPAPAPEAAPAPALDGGSDDAAAAAGLNEPE